MVGFVATIITVVRSMIVVTVVVVSMSMGMTSSLGNGGKVGSFGVLYFGGIDWNTCCERKMFKFARKEWW